MRLQHSLKLIPFVAAALLAASCASAPKEPVRLGSAPCNQPPVLRCPEGEDCGRLVTEQGPVVDAESGRRYFVDYPCDLKPDEDVTVVLSLHGGGSFGNWQRHYFPIADHVDAQRLVVITPNAPPQRWTAEADDVYLQRIIETTLDQVGRKNVKAFWLAGHSQGSMTSRRLVCTDYFKDKVDGFLSISGGRIGGSAGFGPTGFGPAPQSQTPSPDVVPSPTRPASATAGAPDPACDFSHINILGEHETARLLETSTWADKFGCTSRRRMPDIVDTKAGYVYDSSRQNPPTLSWGRKARGGTAEAFVFEGCRDGRVVADVVRLDKGHTEGWEPNVTAEVVRLMKRAKGGKIKASAG